ncbi:MAG: hypothetical protein ACJ79H_04335 [Myxococcales bacterium]
MRESSFEAIREPVRALRRRRAKYRGHNASCVAPFSTNLILAEHALGLPRSS